MSKRDLSVLRAFANAKAVRYLNGRFAKSPTRGLLVNGRALEKPASSDGAVERSLTNHILPHRSLWVGLCKAFTVGPLDPNRMRYDIVL
jgi:hypothetical protein